MNLYALLGAALVFIIFLYFQSSGTPAEIPEMKDFESEDKNYKPPLSVNPSNPVVSFAISIGGKKMGNIEMELKKDVVPKTAENFKQLCTHEKVSINYV